MLIRSHDKLEEGLLPELKKTADGRDVTRLGAFPCGTQLLLCIRLPRALGIAAPVLRIAENSSADVDLPFSFFESERGIDEYRLLLDTAALCKNAPYGLFYYELVFVRGWETLFSDTPNNVDLRLSSQPATRFRLLVYEKEYTTPAWFRGGTMYHIFLDRFCRGEGAATPHADAVIDPDWQNGIPQYAPRAGAPLSNNVFFGGNLWGVIQKLDYLQALGVTVLYLSPLFKAYSNHRYDTGDYEQVDALLGGEEAFDALIREAHARDMRVILDGVFNHTGDDSRYFNKRGNYPDLGAYQSPHSPYARWFSFRSFPDAYESWWNIEIMPRLQHTNEDCRHYFTASGGIAQKWLLRGADGWRLDVADELSDEFLDELRKTVKEATGNEGIIIGEVWENAADKISYGKRRRYLSGRQLDSVMNYPFRNAVLSLLCDRDTETFYHILTELYGSYPRDVSNSLMNLLGTHDTERILTKLGDDGKGECCVENADFARLRLTETQYACAVQKLQLAATLQFTVFGVPSVYYGDEAGLQGYHDPFCRMPFPWGKEDASLLAHYRALGAMRRRHGSLKDGDFRFLVCEKTYLAYEREGAGERLRVLVNLGNARTVSLADTWRDAITETELQGERILPPMSARVLYRRTE